MIDAPVNWHRTFHGVFNETDDHASHPANIDLACMLVLFTEARTIVEAGTYKGHFAFAVANILRLLGHGMVYTADIEDRIPECAWQDVPELAARVSYHRGDFLTMLADVPGEVDLAYIDASDKDNPHLRWEHAEAAYHRLRLGGLLLVDDTAAEDWGDARSFREWASIQLPQHRGLTIVQKR